MFLEWLLPLAKYVTVFNVFKYLTFRAAYAALTALLICFLAGPSIIEWLKVIKFGQAIRKDGPESHLIKTGTPTMGGVFIIFSVVASVLLWQDLKNVYTWITLASLIGFALIGFLDDWTKVKYKNPDGISAKLKFSLQLLVSLGIVLAIFYSGGSETTKLYIPFFKNAVIDLGYFYIPFGVIFLTGWSNAVNLTDGLDGLATGLSILAFIAIGIIIYVSGRFDWSTYLSIPFIKGSGELTVFTLSLVGACVGFLWYNSHPAQVFMGDVGSLSLGGILGTLALIVKKEILLFVIGGVFIVEVLSVMIQISYFKISKGKRIFKMAPIHHHFELKGWKETKVVVRFWIIGGMLAILALTTLKIQ